MFRHTKYQKNPMMVLSIVGLVVGMMFSNVLSVYGDQTVSAANLSSNDYQFKLKINQTSSLESGSIQVKFLNVTADSRCPSDVKCVWEGEVRILVNIIKGNQDLGDFNLITRSGDKDLSIQVFDGHSIKIVKVEPYPTSGKKIPLSDYVTTLVISKSEILSPHLQFKSGTLPENIQCKDGLQLIIKTTDGSPACVKPDTATTLVSWGWAKSIIGTVRNSGGSQPQNKIITLADNGKSITLQKGDSFLLKLGEMYNWNIDIDNQTVVSRMVNMMVVRGAQGVYDAHNPGHTILTAVGDPLCRSSVPACGMPSIQFKFDITVVPTLDNSNNLAILTDKDQYKTSETIGINITNNGNTRLFPVGWGYSIDDANGTHYAPTGVLRMMLVALTPGNSVHWTWNQLDANGTQVNPGKYNITASYTEENTLKQFSASKIIEIASP